MGAIGFGARLTHRIEAGRVFEFSGGVMPVGATLTRASAGTRIDASGALVSEAADVARFDHDPATGAVRGLLVEPAATNAFLASRDLTAAAWAKSAVTTGVSAIVETASGGAHYVSQAPAFAAGTTYCLSAAAKEAATGAKRYLILFVQASAFGSALNAKFDLATGAIVFVSAGLSASVSPAPGGRWLCAIAATATSNATAGTSNAMVRLGDAAGSATTYTGDGASGIDATDCQIETGPTPTSRIVTTAAAATRAADVLTLDWRGRGVADGAATVRYVFDDGSLQDLATVVSGGFATVPAGMLARARVRRAGVLV